MDRCDDGYTMVDASPMLVAEGAAMDGVGGFMELWNAYDVDTFEISGVMYAIVAAVGDDGVQLIDVSDPEAPVAVGWATDGEDGFTELDGACAVKTFQIPEDSSTYAIVAARDDDGVQLIDITDPTTPVAVGAATDGDGGFTVLNYASDVDTFEVGGAMYAIVAARDDDGVQVIDITDPAAPVPKGVANEEMSDYSELDGAQGVKTFQIQDAHYAIVAAEYDDGVQLIDVSNPTALVAMGTAEDGEDFTMLNDAFAVDTFVLGYEVYAIVTAMADDGVQLIDVTNPSAPVAIGTALHNVGSMLELDGPYDVETFVMGDSMYAIIAAYNDNGVQLMDISDPTAPVAVAYAEDNVGGMSKLQYAAGLSTFTIGFSMYAIVAAVNDHGVQLIRMGDAPVCYDGSIAGGFADAAQASWEATLQSWDVTGSWTT